MHRGYWKFWRKTEDYGYFKEENHSLFVFWLWCLNNAAWKEKDILVKGQQVHLDPGQFVMGRKSAAEELGLSEQTIRTFKRRLEANQQLTIRATNKFSIITIVNWDTYQSDEDTNQPATQPANQPTTNQQLTSNQPQQKKDRKKEEKNNPPYTPPLGDAHFDTFWNLYPKKKAKAAAVKAWSKIKFNNGLFEEILAAVRAAAESDDWQRDGGQFIPFPGTWLNGRRWEDDVHAEAATEKQISLSEYLRRQK